MLRVVTTVWCGQCDSGCPSVPHYCGAKQFDRRSHLFSTKAECCTFSGVAAFSWLNPASAAPGYGRGRGPTVSRVVTIVRRKRGGVIRPQESPSFRMTVARRSLTACATESPYDPYCCAFSGVAGFYRPTRPRRLEGQGRGSDDM